MYVIGGLTKQVVCIAWCTVDTEPLLQLQSASEIEQKVFRELQQLTREKERVSLTRSLHIVRVDVTHCICTGTAANTTWHS